VNDDEIHLLRFVASHYVRGLQEHYEMAQQFQALQHEREQWQDATSRPDLRRRAEGELAEIERAGRGLERSLYVCAERARALELLVAGCVEELGFVHNPALAAERSGPASARGSWQQRRGGSGEEHGA
jgi:hypothetical protein